MLTQALQGNGHFQPVRFERFLLNRKRQLQHFSCFRESALLAVELSKRGHGPGMVRMFAAQQFFADRHRALEKPLDLGEPFLRHVVRRKCGEVRCNFRVIGAVSFSRIASPRFLIASASVWPPRSSYTPDNACRIKATPRWFGFTFSSIASARRRCFSASSWRARKK